MTVSPSASAPVGRASGSWEYNIDLDVITCDARWYEILGLDPVASPITTIQAFRSYIHPDDIGIATFVDLTDVDRLLAEDAPYHRDFRIIHSDGAVRWLRSVACLILEDGQRKAIGCITDVTDYLARREAPRIEPAVGASKVGSPLSRREHDCLLWVTHGKTAWETATIIGLSPRTVEFHLGNAARKLGGANKVQAATLAIRRGLI